MKSRTARNVLVGLLLSALALPGSAQPFSDGEVLAGLPDGGVARFSPEGDREGKHGGSELLLCATDMGGRQQAESDLAASRLDMVGGLCHPRSVSHCPTSQRLYTDTSASVVRSCCGVGGTSK